MAYEGGTMNADGALRDVFRQLPGGGQKWKHGGFYGKREGNARKIIHGVIELGMADKKPVAMRAWRGKRGCRHGGMGAKRP